jgi:hypothetical protein
VLSLCNAAWLSDRTKLYYKTVKSTIQERAINLPPRFPPAVKAIALRLTIFLLV